MTPSSLATRSRSVRCRFIGGACLALALAVTALLIEPGWGECSTSDGSFKIKSRFETQIAKSAGKRAPKNEYVAFLAKRNGASGTLRRDRRLYAPFQVQLTLGAFDSRRAAWGNGSVGASLLDASFVGPSFHSVEVTRSGDGIAVQAQSQPGSIVHPTLLLPNSLLAEVSLEHTGTELIFRARAPGDAQFQELGRNAITFTGPYVGSFDIADLAAKAIVGMDDLTILESTPPPDLSTPLARAKSASDRGIEALLDAGRAADPSVSDATALDAALTVAATRLDEALVDLDALGKPVRKSRNLVAKARKGVAKVQKKLDQGKSASSTARLVRTTTQKALKGVERLPN